MNLRDALNPRRDAEGYRDWQATQLLLEAGFVKCLTAHGSPDSSASTNDPA
jgi:hypothetical protein